jgi:hypothetical protein
MHRPTAHPHPLQTCKALGTASIDAFGSTIPGYPNHITITNRYLFNGLRIPSQNHETASGVNLRSCLLGLSRESVGCIREAPGASAEKPRELDYVSAREVKSYQLVDHASTSPFTTESRGPFYGCYNSWQRSSERGPRSKDQVVASWAEPIARLAFHVELAACMPCCITGPSHKLVTLRVLRVLRGLFDKNTRRCNQSQIKNIQFATSFG